MNINLEIVLFILLIHWVADFVFQTDWQAQNKSKNNWALGYHVATYSLVWIIAAILILNARNAILFTFITATCHFAQDYITSRLNSKLWREQKVHYFFVSIGFDQFLHYTQLLLTFYFLTN